MNGLILTVAALATGQYLPDDRQAAERKLWE